MKEYLQGLMGLLLAALFGLAGCSGDDGEPGPPGPPGPPAGVDIGNATQINAAITGVSIASPPVVEFTLTDGNSNPIKNLPPSAISFKLAKLTPGTDGNPSAWQSYINEEEPPGVGPGTEAKVQATTENGSAGELVDNDDGSYTYTFSLDVAAVTDPVAVDYNPDLTHRVSFEIRGYVPVSNPVYTFRPADGATAGLFSREIAKTATCNNCHENLALHGDARFEMQECVTCHNPGSADANSGNTVDMTVMIHKIHHGENLPSVIAGGDYCIWGFRDIPHCYNDVVHPQDIRACSNCHDADDPDTPDASNWYTMPTVEACGSCHDDVDFAGGTNHPAADNTTCVTCHASNPESRLEVRQAHRIITRELAANYEYQISNVTTPGPGGAPVATLAVVNPQDTDAPYDLELDPDLVGSSLRLSVSWTTEEISNVDNGRNNLSPEATNLYSDDTLQASPNGDFTYDLQLGTVPGGVSGSGIVVFEGAVPSDQGSLGVTNAHRFFAITDDPDAPAPRRTSVDIARCNDCHDSLSFHGGRNTDSIAACVTCHNPNAARGGTPSRGPMDAKHFIHRIHAADPIRYPQRVSNCLACHVEDGFYPVTSGSGVLPTSTNRGVDEADPFDNDRITANSATCGVCHSSDDARIHMEQNGGSLDACLLPDGTVFRKVADCGVDEPVGEVTQESCTVCHGPGRSSDAARVHGL